ncbi:MAG: hypothetical protein ACREQ2_29250 [Candidatus Binatia bacterium]
MPNQWLEIDAPPVAQLSLRRYAGHEMNANSSIHSPSKVQPAILLTVVVLTAPLWLAVVVIVLLARLFQAVVLYALVWAWWIGWARRRVLFVYSEQSKLEGTH